MPILPFVRTLFSLVLLSLFATFNLFSQDTSYVRGLMIKLGSKEFYGRGYENNGNAKAAKFIASEFQKMNIQSFDKSFYQSFSFPINTLPEVKYLKINNSTLRPAVDYYLAKASTSRKGTFKLVFVNDSLFLADSLYKVKLLSKDLSQSFLVFKKDLKKDRFTFTQPLGGLIFLHEKDISYWHFRNGQRPVNYAIIDLLAEKLPASTSEISINFTSRFYQNYPTQNVVAFVKGKLYPDSFMVIGAHYDHLGTLGKSAVFTGGNDNASGTSMVLDLARHFSKPENQPDYSLVFITFTGEEVGLIGSFYFVDNPLVPLKNIRFMLNLDMVGTGSEGIGVVNGIKYDKAFQLLESINTTQQYLPKFTAGGESCNSDHCPFDKAGIPSFFIFTKGNEYMEYHTIRDLPQRVPLTNYNGVFKLLKDYINQY
jgi:hypothetical protein